MTTSFATSRDGTRIAYDRTGEGRPLVLLHGGFVQDRSAWHGAGYIGRLSDAFSVIAVDLRGHGESDRPAGTEAYGAERMIDDALAILDAEGIERASAWGYSLGASVALQVAARSDRLDAVVLGGAALGPWLTQEAAAAMTGMMEAAAAAKAQGKLDALPLPAAQMELAKSADLKVAISVIRAMVAWPIIEPAAIRGRSMFYVGVDHALSLGSIKKYEAALDAAKAHCEVLDGLDHKGEFEAVDRVVRLAREFLEQG